MLWVGNKHTPPPCFLTFVEIWESNPTLSLAQPSSSLELWTCVHTWVVTSLEWERGMATGREPVSKGSRSGDRYSRSPDRSTLEFCIEFWGVSLVLCLETNPRVGTLVLSSCKVRPESSSSLFSLLPFHSPFSFFSLLLSLLFSIGLEGDRGKTLH